MRNGSPEDRAFVKELSRRVRLNRRIQDLTQAELGERAGISRNFVAAFETGEHGIDVANLRRIADALGLPLPTLVDVRIDGEERAP